MTKNEIQVLKDLKGRVDTLVKDVKDSEDRGIYGMSHLDRQNLSFIDILFSDLINERIL